MATPALSIYSQPQNMPSRFQHRRAWSYVQNDFMYAHYLPSTSLDELFSSPKTRRSPTPPDVTQDIVPLHRQRPSDGRNMTRGVTFADERGLQLCEVREFKTGDIEEQVFSSCKPRFRLSAQRSHHDSTETKCRLNWSVDFPMPSLDYNSFFARLGEECLCLENAFVDGLRVLGFVRVKNISFQKSVRLRLTYDGWKSHEDVPCEYYQPQVPGGQNFDQFQFCFPLPVAKKDAKIEFAICFSTPVGEFWDNNKERNYALRVKETVVRSNS